MKKFKKLWRVFLVFTLLIESYSTFAFDQTYFNSLPDKDKQTINLINSVNSSVVSITWKKKVTQTTTQCFIIFNWICITSWDTQPTTQSWIVDIVKWSWFFVTSNWYIITNKHVVEQTDLTYEVMTLDGKIYPATVLSRSNDNDVAILKIVWNNFSFLKLYHSDNLMIGQWVYAIWNTLWEYQNTVTEWIVSWLNRTITTWWQNWDWQEVLSWAIQTSASISPWNSGWPLIDSIWNVIGINTAIDLGWQNIWFAIPSKVIIDFVAGYKNSLKK